MMNDKEPSPSMEWLGTESLGIESQGIESLLDSRAYDHPVAQGVELIETHISWVLLAGDFAYKIKKPVCNSFLDYSTLERRHHYCEEEVRLNRRFAAELYLDVVPITTDGHTVRIGGHAVRSGCPNRPIEYAVRMRRFPSDDLLSHRLNRGQVSVHDVRKLAMRVGEFHTHADSADEASEWGSPQLLIAEALDNFRVIEQMQILRVKDCVQQLRSWSEDFFHSHQEHFAQRQASGHIRQCHGDLHLSNIVLWKGELLPFDGIEFCSSFHWIDTLSDAAFTAMDFAAHGRMDYCNSFINATFEASGDYAAVALLPWYLVYRTLVRAKVAAMRMKQLESIGREHQAVGTESNHDAHVHRQQEPDLDSLLDLAYRFTQAKCDLPTLWITYGVSGSGKTTGSEHFVQGQGAVRVRADVERKRLAQQRLLTPERNTTYCELYNEAMTRATYERLVKLAEEILSAGRSTIIDATCLMRWQRDLFRDLANRLHVDFQIVPFHADHAVLRDRIAVRQSLGQDASDADLHVLQSQLERQEHLAADELPFAIPQPTGDWHV